MATLQTKPGCTPVGELKEHFRRAYQVAREIIERTMRFGREGIGGFRIAEIGGLRTWIA